MQGSPAAAERLLGAVGSPRRRTRMWLFGIGIFVALVLAIGLNTNNARAYADGYVDTDVLNLRDGPGTWASVVTQMWQGEYVGVLDGPNGDGWYQVEYQGSVGWAYGGYLAVNGQSGWASDVGSSSSGVWSTAWVATDSLNMRSWAGLDAPIVGSLWTGAEVSVTGAAVNGFVPITSGGISAWVASDLLSWDGPVAQTYQAAPQPSAERWVDVNRSTQMVTLYEGNVAVASYWAALGWDNSSDGFYSTAIGTHYVYSKYRDISWTDWGQVYIKFWVGFDESRVNGFHSYSLDANGNVLANGDGPTGGCVALALGAAEHVFDFVDYGTRIEVHW